MSKQKIVVLLIALILIVCAVVAWSQTPQRPPDSGQPSSGIPGRYQLFQGQFTIVSSGTPFKDVGVFKLDTQTGHTWVYAEGRNPDGQFYKEWKAVQN